MTRSLKDGLPGTGTDPTLGALDTTREPQQAQPVPQLVEVFVVNGTRTSAGPGPGPLKLPPLEAGALVRQRLAVYGSRPPNVPDPEPVTKPFTGTHDPFPPRAGTRSGISN
jgi:hypothetical protein